MSEFGLSNMMTVSAAMQVCAGVRMALYHTGKLERAKAGSEAGCISRAWHDVHDDLAALCQELHRWQQRMLYAPKFLHQVGTPWWRRASVKPSCL